MRLQTLPHWILLMPATRQISGLLTRSLMVWFNWGHTLIFCHVCKIVGNFKGWQGIYLSFEKRCLFSMIHPVFPGGKGRRVVASDVVFSFARISIRKSHHPEPGFLTMWKKSKNDFPFTLLMIRLLSFGFKNHFPPFLGILTTLYCSVVPHEAIEKFGTDFRKNPVGTGPFRFKIWKEGVKLVLEKTQTILSLIMDNRLPYLDAIAITFLADKQSAFLEFVNGKLDFMSGIDPGYKDEPSYTGW